jgi:long-chain fatty acid transport protein
MPAFGWGRRSGRLSYGLALFAQGGMGTEYSSQSFLALGSNEKVRSELGVGRVILPVAWQATPELAIGGSVDLVWASLDMKMAATGAQLGGMVTGADGTLATVLPALAEAPWARVDFSDDSKFTGAANATGWAGKLGLVYTVSPTLRVGLSHHLKSSLKDLRSGRSDTRLSAPGFEDSGRITIQDFQMPAQTALGVAWQATPATLLAADLKHIGWSDVMESFRMRYDSAVLGGSVSFAMTQQWKDQTVLQLGAAHRLNVDWVLRAGANLANNPVPDATVNPLFPAIVKNHLTLGAGWTLAASREINASMAYAPRVTADTPSGVVISHRQLNLQLMLSQRF